MDDIEKAISILNSGGIIIYPTDTAYGIGCRSDMKSSVRRLYQIRKRPENKAVPLLAGSKSMALKYFRKPVNQKIKRLMDKYWPGALTIVYYKNNNVNNEVTGGGETVGIRVPDNDKIREIINRIGVPVLGPSANFHKMATPYDFGSLDPKLAEKADLVIKGICMKKEASTVIDCTVYPYKILRQGAVDLI